MKAENPQAFPQTVFDELRDGPVAFTDPAQRGMTLRDYFAAAAMQGSLAHNAELRIEDGLQAHARWCYLMADAMLSARSTPSKESPSFEKEATGQCQRPAASDVDRDAFEG